MDNRDAIIDGLRAQMQALGLTPADLAAESTWPTVAEAVEELSTSGRHAKGTYSRTTLRDYRRNWAIFVDRHGDERLGDLHDEDIEEDLDAVLEQAEARLAERNKRRQQRGQRAIDSSCHGAQEMYLNAVRAVFSRQYRHRRMDVQGSPAHMVSIGKRPPGRRRPLSRSEVEDLFRVAVSGGNDPMLDVTLVRGAYELGARQEGLINLRPEDLDFKRQSVWLDEKNAKRREQPASRDLLRMLKQIGDERGATAGEALLRFKPTKGSAAGSPLTSRRFDTLFARVRMELQWADEVMAGSHFLRHTIGRRIERFAGKAIARAFLGHAPADTTDGYTGALDGEVARAWSRVTHEPHPLAEQVEEGW